MLMSPDVLKLRREYFEQSGLITDLAHPLFYRIEQRAFDHKMVSVKY